MTTTKTVVEFHPHPAQQQILRSKARFPVVRAGRRFGKALALDTPVPTPDGWTKMGELNVGDQVYDERGEPCTVTFATDVQYGRPCYEVVFGDGSKIVADGEHRWVTWDKSARKALGRAKNPRAGPEVRSTVEIRRTIGVVRKDGRFEANHRVQVAAPLQGRPVALPIKPYTLGAWLGDGSSTRAYIYTDDQEIIDNIQSDGYPAKRKKANFEWSLSDGVRSRYKTKTMHQTLTTTGLYGNKHIPSVYYLAPPGERWSLLEGLMDTDGYTSTGGHCEFTTTKESLATDVFRLVASLGLVPHLYKGRATLNGRDVGPKFRVYFRSDRPVFRLTRKRERQLSAPVQKGSGFRSIVEVRSVHSVPVRCITVDSPSHLYLAGDGCVPTHNTEIGAAFLLMEGQKFVARGHDPESIKLWWAADIYKHAEEALDKLTAKTTTQGNPNPWYYVCKKPTRSPGDMRVPTRFGFEIEFRSAEKERALVAAGVHAAVFDEAAAARERSWDTELRATLMDVGGRCMLVSTPKGRNYFHRLCKLGRERRGGYEEFHFSSHDNPHITKAEIEQLAESMTPRGYEQEILANFLQDVGAVFSNPQECVDKALLLEHERGAFRVAGTPVEGRRYAAGWDVAKKTDWSVLNIDDMEERRTVLWDRFQKMPYHKQAYRVAYWCAVYNAALLLDVTGVGDPVHEIVDKLVRGGLLDEMAEQNESVPEAWEKRLAEEGSLFRLVPADEGFQYTQKSRQNLVDNLASLIGERSTSWPELPIMTNEFEAFEYGKGGKEMAPPGEHDDAVMAKGLATWLSARWDQYVRSREPRVGFV